MVYNYYRYKPFFACYNLVGLHAMEKRSRFMQSFCKFELSQTRSRCLVGFGLETTRALVDSDSTLTF